MDGLYYGVGRAIVDGVLGFGLLFAVIWLWSQLAKFSFGRVIVFALTTAIYFGGALLLVWLAYMTFFGFPSSPWSHVDDLGSGVFALVASVILCAFFGMLGFVWLGFWDTYARFAEDAVRLRLPRIDFKVF